MGGHHLILGKLTDFLTGETLDDTLDERYRQKIARWLVERKGYGAREVEPRRELMLQADHRRAVITIDFVVRVAGKAGMVIRFGPGSTGWAPTRSIRSPRSGRSWRAASPTATRSTAPARATIRYAEYLEGTSEK